MKRLSEKEELFCLLYAGCRNGRQAAKGAGYVLHPARHGSRLLLRPEIRARIEALSPPPSAGEALAGYRNLAFGDNTDAIRLVFCDALPDEATLAGMQLANISEIKRPKGGGLEIKFFDRFKALERLEQISGAGQAPAGAQIFYDAMERGALALQEDAQ